MAATTYYIDSVSGNDANNGTSTATPFKTLAKIQTKWGIIVPGDTISLKKGSIFYEPLSINVNGNTTSNITFNNYGSGNNPIISGFTTISSWTNLGGGIYQSNVISPQTTVNMLTIDGVQYAQGRYPAVDAPNGGYLTVGSKTNNSITSTTSLPTTYTGATVVARSQHWRLDKTTISSQSGNTINFTTPLPNAAVVNWGFFIQNHPSTLVNFGDWCYDSTSHTIKVYFGASDPTTHTTKVSTIDSLITLQSAYNTIDGIDFEGAAIFGITAQITRLGTVIKNCNFNFIGQDGINFSGQNGSSITNCTFNYCNSTGINMNYLNMNTSIKHNALNNIGLFAGAGRGGFYTAIANNQAGVIASNNITNVGYAGISFGGTKGNVIQYNYVDNCCLITDDGSAIYGIVKGDIAGDNLINNNIVSNAVGNSYGTTQTGNTLAHGIYFDSASTGYSCINNTIFNCADSGIFVHGNTNFIVSGNTVLNCGVCQLLVQDNEGTPATKGIITNNIFFSADSTQLCMLFINGGPTTPDMVKIIGTFSNNAYCRPSNENNIIDNQYSFSHHYFNLATWKSTYPTQDITSVSTPTGTLSSTPTIHFNNTVNPTIVNLSGVWKDMFSNIKTGSISLPVFTSILILQTSNAGGNIYINGKRIILV